MRLKQLNKEVIVGKFGSPHGVRGALKLFAYGQSTKQLASYKPWLIQNEQGEWQNIDVATCDVKPGFIIVTLKDIDDRDKARSFTNKEVAVYAESLAVLPADEYYWQELIGLEVVNHLGIAFGQVTDLFATGANDVLVVKNDKGEERLIPFVIDVHVIEIDEKNNLIKVEWDEDF